MLQLKGNNMTKKPLNVYQFKIKLLGIKPLIWRRIRVIETYTFWDLHVAIQDSMGWTDSHLHEFNIVNPNTTKNAVIGFPDELADFINEDRIVLAGWDQKISDFFSLENHVAKYDYDFGDDWQHEIVLEKIIPKEPNVKYPQCLAGARACPPEDCGGIWGYSELLEILADPTHPEHQERLEWLGGAFNSEDFDASKVRFDNPKKRWEYAFNIEEGAE